MQVAKPFQDENLLFKSAKNERIFAKFSQTKRWAWIKSRIVPRMEGCTPSALTHLHVYLDRQVQGLYAWNFDGPEKV